LAGKSILPFCRPTKSRHNPLQAVLERRAVIGVNGGDFPIKAHKMVWGLYLAHIFNEPLVLRQSWVNSYISNVYQDLAIYRVLHILNLQKAPFPKLGKGAGIVIFMPFADCPITSLT
jgi:hypothetical protein